MKKITVTALSFTTLLITGCAATLQPRVEIIDKEPILVGKPVSERIRESSEEINAQLSLLQKVQAGGQIGDFSIVQHNNNLDARVGSDNTIPLAYAKINEPEKKTVEKKDVIVKRIEWTNNSLNTLVGNYAKAMNYQVAIKPSNLNIADKNIDFSAENMSLSQSLVMLKEHVKNVADIVVIDKNKTINVFYK